MASSAKSPRIGLSLWTAEDRPQRTDFLQDNQQVETLLGDHLENTTIHLTAEEKGFLANPVSITTYIGNGNASRNVDYGGSIHYPRFVFVYAIGTPLMAAEEGGQGAYCAAASYGTGSTPGITLRASNFTVTQQAEAGSGGLRCSLNESGKSYVVLIIP